MKKYFDLGKKYWIIGLFISLFFFITIGVIFDLSYIIETDKFIFKLIEPLRCNFFDIFFFIFTFIGEPIFVILILIILILLPKREKISFPIISFSVFSFIINFSIKNIIKRDRPIDFFHKNNLINYSLPTSFSYPSGHAQTSSFLFVMIGIMLYKYKNKKRFIIIFSIIGLFIGFSRIYFGVHNFSDVIAGFSIFGILLLFFLNYLIFNDKKNISENLQG